MYFFYGYEVMRLRVLSYEVIPRHRGTWSASQCKLTKGNDGKLFTIKMRWTTLGLLEVINGVNMEVFIMLCGGRVAVVSGSSEAGANCRSLG